MPFIDYNPKVDRSSRILVSPDTGVLTKIKRNAAAAENEAELLTEWQRRLKEFSSPDLEIKTPTVISRSNNRIRLEYLPYDSVQELLASNTLTAEEKKELVANFEKFCDFKMTKGLLHGNTNLDNFLYKPQKGPRDKAIIVLLSPQNYHSVSTSRRALLEENHQLLSKLNQMIL